ncbi:RNA-binding domain-containing protein [Thelephora terrestris]|uniref:RNA-binding domain-containing protein n=1 Tax=Thelephora terrestris TaxID=56493 RepID=A0A9P6HH01_9AGAM|nr:RNA-binding domain-containing protein [Thelephora terrestris]
MEDAWQSDIAPINGEGGIGIPSDTAAANGGAEDPAWNGDGRGDAPRRSSRSRSPARGDKERSGRGFSPGGQNPGNNLHVSGLSHRVDSKELENHFAAIGRVQKAQVMRDPHSHESRGFGFVTMESAAEADAAIAALNGQDFLGKVLSIEKARRGRARTPTPGRYYGPPKRHERDRGHGLTMADRMYDPRPYDDRYNRRPDDRERPRDRYRDRYDEPRYDDRRYDDRRSRYEDRRY